MKKRLKKPFEQNHLSKLFIQAAQSIVDRRIVKNFREIADRIGWTESSISSVKAAKINVPIQYIKTFETEFKIPLITGIDSKDHQSRFLRIEAILEVYGIQIAASKAKTKEDFPQKFSELQTLISEAVARRKEQEGD